MKAKTLNDDIACCRWKKGEVGNVLINDFPKYDYKVDFGEADAGGLWGMKTFRRIVYFYAAEVEVSK